MVKLFKIVNDICICWAVIYDFVFLNKNFTFFIAKDYQCTYSITHNKLKDYHDVNMYNSRSTNLIYQQVSHQKITTWITHTVKKKPYPTAVTSTSVYIKRIQTTRVHGKAILHGRARRKIMNLCFHFSSRSDNKGGRVLKSGVCYHFLRGRGLIWFRGNFWVDISTHPFYMSWSV